MIDLARHIEVLLLNNDCVIVPGLGGFLAQQIPARRVENEGLFLPPTRTIGFNSQLRFNDGLLIQSYMEAYDDSFPEASNRVENDVKNLINELRSKGEYEFNGIGKLSMNIDGVYNFTPNEAGALSPSLYGFGSFSMKPLAAIDSKANESALSNTNNKANVSNKDVAAQGANTSSNEQNRKAEIKPIFSISSPNGNEDSKNKTININLKVSWIRNTVAIAATILLFFMVTNKVENTYVDKAYYVSNNQGRLFDAIKDKSMATSLLTINEPADSKDANVYDIVGKVTNAESTKPVVSASATEEKTNAKPEVAKNSKETKESFCVVLASAVPKSSALKFVAELKNDGFKSTRIYETNNVLRVVYGNYPSKEVALCELKKLRNNKYFAESWILKQD